MTLVQNASIGKYTYTHEMWISPSLATAFERRRFRYHVIRQSSSKVRPQKLNLWFRSEFHEYPSQFSRLTFDTNPKKRVVGFGKNTIPRRGCFTIVKRHVFGQIQAGEGFCPRHRHISLSVLPTNISNILLPCKTFTELVILECTREFCRTRRCTHPHCLQSVTVTQDNRYLISLAKR